MMLFGRSGLDLLP